MLLHHESGSVDPILPVVGVVDKTAPKKATASDSGIKVNSDGTATIDGDLLAALIAKLGPLTEEAPKPTRKRAAKTS
jgi:hypothetical protein